MNNTTKTKHTPEKWIAAGCTIYTADYWCGGLNYGGKRIGDTVDPDNDSLPNCEEKALCEQIVREHNSQPELLAALQAILAEIMLSQSHLVATRFAPVIDQAIAAIRQATVKPELNWIVIYNGEPIRRLVFEGTKANLIVGTVAEAIRYSPEEAAEVAVAIGRGAEVVHAAEATI